jgi:peptidoglycan/xylan/chitin deacetylase (PgdA/CDA1 family)
MTDAPGPTLDPPTEPQRCPAHVSPLGRVGGERYDARGADAYAAELGYTLVMWDIDTEDWRQPGAEAIVSTVLTQVFPGAVVLFHDGGGDCAQTVQALERILEALSGQGYVFEVLCSY